MTADEPVFALTRPGGPRARVAVLRQDARLNGPILDLLRHEGLSVEPLESVDDLLAMDGERAMGIEVIVAPGAAPIDDRVLARLPSLRGVLSTYMGVEGFDRAAATARGVLIGNGHIPESIESMAEGTILMLLAAAYRLPTATAAMADGGWPKAVARGRLVRAMTVGIVGFGKIAQAVAERLRPFGCHLMVYAPRLPTPIPAGLDVVPLERLVASSDAIILLASLGAGSRHMIDADLLGRVKPGAIIVNMARGGLIDEAALIDAARAGNLGCLALDVFEEEPLPAGSALRTLPDAILTPHCIGHTTDTLARLPFHAVEGVRRLLRGEPPPSLVNPEALPAWRQRVGALLPAT